MTCPQCKQEIKDTEHKAIDDELAKLREKRSAIEKMALEVAKNQGLDKEERLSIQGDAYYNDLLGLAMHSCAFYECFECEKPFFGGMVDCQAQLGVEENNKKENLRCKDCIAKAFGAGSQDCEKHG